MTITSNNMQAAIVCDHIACENQPILRAIRTEPVIPEDSGWQFLCNQAEFEKDAKIWSIGEVISFEPSLLPFLNIEYNNQIERKDDKSQWEISEYISNEEIAE